MTFSAAQKNYMTLKKRLAVHVSANALADITVDVPEGEKDELSFLRLVAWSYIVIYETGKVPLGFLKELPPLNKFEPLMPHVHALRTWMSHNLSLEKERDIATLKKAHVWLRNACSKGTPSTSGDWEKCFAALCTDIACLLSDAINACDALDSEVDGQRLVDELKRRLDRTWDGFRFDSYVKESMERLGYSGLSIVDFRGRHLDRWRKVVAAAENHAIDHLLTLSIEADILKFMENALPIASKEMLRQLDCDNPEKLALVMLVIRQQGEKDHVNLPKLIQSAFEEVAKSKTPAG